MKDKLIYLINDKQVKRDLFYRTLENYTYYNNPSNHTCTYYYDFIKKQFNKYKRELLYGFFCGSKDFGAIFKIDRTRSEENA